ncbi:hypothetical protein L218DRAFT_983255 [Marasmius fiardii PR-910]|nr:hypothetical protein L218DRAFT_983255 [Marasmius fiardii PR-910]
MPAPKFSGTAGDAVGNVLPFRVGPWVPYEPPSTSSQTSTFGVMDHDVDMDAPQISTLREEETPPPPKANNPRFKLKLVVKDKTKTITSSSAGKTHPGEEEEGEDEEDDQEDQLIDDDDDGPIPASLLSSKRKAAPVATPSGSGKRKSRKSDHGSKKSEGGGEGHHGKLKEKVTQNQQSGAPNLAPTMSWFQANPATERPEDSGTEGRSNITHEDLDAPLALPATSRKKGSTKKAPSKKAKTSSTKLKLRMPQLPPEDTVSEAGMTGTAASSPIAIHIDEPYSPEPEGVNSSSNIPIETSEATSAQNVEQPMNLEGVPVPIYPLPTKPFPVLPPPKISSGFAPNLPLDKTKTRVRHWRVANREIRGIAGGRWFTRAWVGEKESEFATALQAGKAASAAAAANGVEGTGSGATTGKGGSSGHSGSAPPGGKGSKKKMANSSRSGSSVPEPNGTGTVGGSVHGPSKMRISQMAPPPAPSSEAGDDMAVSAA